MKKPSINHIEDKLIELIVRYADLQPEFYKVELEYIQKRAEKLMSAEVSGLGNQGMREAECDRLMAETPEYEKYHKLKPEIDVLNRQYWMYMELSKLIRSNSREEVR